MIDKSPKESEEVSPVNTLIEAISKDYEKLILNEQKFSRVHTKVENYSINNGFNELDMALVKAMVVQIIQREKNSPKTCTNYIHYLRILVDQRANLPRLNRSKKSPAFSLGSLLLFNLLDINDPEYVPLPTTSDILDSVKNLSPHQRAHAIGCFVHLFRYLKIRLEEGEQIYISLEQYNLLQTNLSLVSDLLSSQSKMSIDETKIANEKDIEGDKKLVLDGLQAASVTWLKSEYRESMFNGKIYEISPTEARNFLIVEILMTSGGNRPQAVYKINCKNFGNAREENNEMVVSISSHKTMKGGNVHVVIFKETYNLVSNYIDKIRPNLVGHLNDLKSEDSWVFPIKVIDQKLPHLNDMVDGRMPINLFKKVVGCQELDITAMSFRHMASAYSFSLDDITKAMDWAQFQNHSYEMAKKRYNPDSNKAKKKVDAVKKYVEEHLGVNISERGREKTIIKSKTIEEKRINETPIFKDLKLNKAEKWERQERLFIMYHFYKNFPNDPNYNSSLQKKMCEISEEFNEFIQKKEKDNKYGILHVSIKNTLRSILRCKSKKIKEEIIKNIQKFESFLEFEKEFNRIQ